MHLKNIVQCHFNIEKGDIKRRFRFFSGSGSYSDLDCSVVGEFDPLCACHSHGCC